VGPHALISSFQYGPEAVVCTFVLTFGWPVLALWLIGQLPMCGFAERLAGRLLRLYWRVLTWPFRWLGGQAQRALRHLGQQIERAILALLRAIGQVLSYPLRLGWWFIWEQLRRRFQNPRNFRPRPRPGLFPRRRRGRPGRRHPAALTP